MELCWVTDPGSAGRGRDSEAGMDRTCLVAFGWREKGAPDFWPGGWLDSGT